MDSASIEPSQPKQVYLTFDDGPCEPFTSRVLDALKEGKAKATFFVCGRNVERHPLLSRCTMEDGHSIGNHTYSHSKMRTFFSSWGKEIAETELAIEETTGVGTRIFRPPWGTTRPWLGRELRIKGYRTFLWDVKANDWVETIQTWAIIDMVVKRVRPGSVVLLHDGERSLERSDRSRTAEAVPHIIEQLSARGYSFERL